ncbi:MAG: riboflavin synthase [Rhodobacteraceae bacterium]|nr:riboflavin synthase [Paracoccaceae bacterium]
MFTGIIEETGTIKAIQPTNQAIALTLRARVCGRGIKRGDSLAVNGCCLTVAKLKRTGRDTQVTLELLRETWERTSFHQVKVGDAVNLERSLRADSRLGGHFVSGHIDAIGRITRWEQSGKDWLLEIAAPAEVLRYVVFKGSIAVDGISLTVAGVARGRFRLWIIPHTRAVTALRERAVGDAVNLEADLIGKYVEQFVKLRRREAK